MSKESNKKDCCSPTGMVQGCCKVEALVSVDERGQMVLPKETREKANIRAGDKLAIISWEKGDNICCLTMIKADDLTDMVKDLLGPLMTEMVQK
jgi:AbrB family looped-hinge helix DNA binding protein